MTSAPTTPTTPWLAAHEGYYGPPLEPEARTELIGWLAGQGYDAFAYAPKDDPFHRQRWREPYPTETLDHIAALAATCHANGMELAVSLSPGLDWRLDDPSELDALTAKLAPFRAIGVDRLCIQWDDVPGEGDVIGDAHGRAVATVVDRLGPDAVWSACPVDYAVDEPTPYLRAFAASLPRQTGLLWTGPSVLSRRFEVDHLLALTGALDHEIHFAENFPVNDVGMAQVLHLGPYPERDPALPAHVSAVFVNFMHRPLASRIGLAVAARFWRSPETDREVAWQEAVDAVPGLEPLARSCRSWIADPSPDPTLVAWAEAAIDAGPGAPDGPLHAYLDTGCRTGLDPALATEVERWLAQWELEAGAMRSALGLLAAPETPDIRAVWIGAAAWHEAQRSRTQIFGIRRALYPMTRHEGGRLTAAHGAVVQGANLTDRLWTAVLDRLH